MRPVPLHRPNRGTLVPGHGGDGVIGVPQRVRIRRTLPRPVLAGLSALGGAALTLAVELALGVI